MAASEFNCVVRTFRNLTPTVFELAFETDKPFHFQAGQYISVIIPGAGPGGRNLRRAYSIASSPSQGLVELCVKFVEEGPGSGYLAGLRPGDTFKGTAPYGDFVYEPKSGRHACFIATGTGIAPIRSILLSKEFMDHPPIRSLCLFGARDEREILYYDELSQHPHAELVVALSQPRGAWKGFSGRITEYIKSLTDQYPWTESEYYLCGNGGMIDEMKEFLEDKGVQKDAIHHEIYYK